MGRRMSSAIVHLDAQIRHDFVFLFYRAAPFIAECVGPVFDEKAVRRATKKDGGRCVFPVSWYHGMAWTEDVIGWG
jgi:hypothetical protein